MKAYDYSRVGAYFITICTHNRLPLFGEILNGEMVLNKLGEFVVMPNHFHGIIHIHESVGAYGHTPLQDNQITLSNHSPLQSDNPATFRSPSKTVGAMLRGYKSTVTKRINILRNTPGLPVWQRNYYEHIIRHEKSYLEITQYILNNPVQWELDQLYPGENYDHLRIRNRTNHPRIVAWRERLFHRLWT